MSQTIQTLLRQLLVADRAAEVADADLLERFAARRDGAAFAVLVARHGPMVLGVCRRLLGDLHDAEDAFQAVFLVLARRAGALRRGDPVGAWLHGVACRTALHARTDRARRRERERRVTPMAAVEPTPPILWEDLRPVLDEEVGRLPDVYRIPVVLCYLGGLTYAEAAAQIGCPKGTVATRLAKAREVLRVRLSGRGVGLPAAGLVAILADNARAALPAVLLQSTVEAATTSVVPPAVATLTAEVLKAMAGSKLKVVFTLLVAAGLLAAGVGVLAYNAAAGDQPAAIDAAGKPAIPEKAPPVTADERPWGEPDAGVQIRIRPQQVQWKAGETPVFQIDVRNRGTEAMNLFPSGIAWEVEVGGVWYGRKMELPPGVVEETPLKPRDKARTFAPDEEVKGWVALRLDGMWLRGVRGEKRIRSERAEQVLPLSPGRHTIRVAYHAHTGFCPMSNPVVIDVAADGNDDRGWIRVRHEAGTKTLLFRPDGTGRTEAATAHPEGVILSPDGRRIAYVVSPPLESSRSGCELFVADADGKNARRVLPAGVIAASPNWSPDGKQIAFPGTSLIQPRVQVADHDGRNLRQVTDATTAPHGATLPKFGADGRLAYLVFGERVGKRQPADLMIGEGKTATAVAKGEVITDYAWAPDGKTIAYGKPGSICFVDVATGKGPEIAFADMDKELAGHAALDISWRPDGRAVACRMVFWGGRQANGPKMLGDEEVFVIPQVGKPSWFHTVGPVRHVEWIGDIPVGKPRPAPAPVATEASLAVGAWSEPVEGLRGRLLLGQGRKLPDLKARETLVYVELEDVADTHAGERAVYFDPEALRCKLTHADGKAAPEYPFGGSGGRGGPTAGWVTIPYDALMRLRANPSGYGSPDGLHIALVNAHYLIKTGDTGEYHLSATLTVTPPAGHGRAKAWAGTLTFPPVKVKAPAPARPSVTDAASEIKVTVRLC